MIVLDHAPYVPFLQPRTARPPGLSPLEPDEWTVVHPDFAAQMAYRTRLIAERRHIVLANEAPDAAAELLDALCDHLARRPDYRVTDDVVTPPDGVTVRLSPGDPLWTIGHLVAEDFCLLQPDATAGEYRLVGAVLCFPSRWLLSEKMGRPLTAIHEPVPDYDAALAARVNRVFEVLRPGRPLVRINWLVHAVPELHLPIGSGAKRVAPIAAAGPFYLRTERQTLVRLPGTGAVAFGIKTSVTPVERLTPEQARGLAAALGSLDKAAMAYRAGAHVIAHAIAELNRIACAAPS